MKKLLTIIFLAIGHLTFAQLAPPKQKIKLNLPPISAPYENNVPVGPFMMLGGASFIAAGLLAPPNMVSGSTTEKQPLIGQLHKVLPIATGSIVFVIGTGVFIADR